MNARPLIIAHRGASADAPENTMAAFRLAIDQGAEGVEFDVRLSRDGFPVVIHDATLKRTGGLDEAVATLTASELGQVDVGSWFDRKYSSMAGAGHKGETVPRLSSVLEFLSGSDGAIYIELKCGIADSTALAAAVCKLLKGSPMLPRIIIKSFALSVIGSVRHHLPEAQTAALFAPKIMDFLRRKIYIVALAHDIGADQISLHRALATRSVASQAAAAGMPITVWTADDPKWIAKCRDLGIGALITNSPGTMLAARSAAGR